MPLHKRISTFLYRSRYIPGVMVDVVLQEYVKGGPCLELIDHETGESVLTATSWLPDIPENLVAIKMFGENDGIVAQLVKAGIIELTGQSMVALSGSIFPLARITAGCTKVDGEGCYLESFSTSALQQLDEHDVPVACKFCGSLGGHRD